jgi:hypothetical protein
MYLIMVNEKYFIYRTCTYSGKPEYRMIDNFDIATKFKNYEDAKEIACIYGGVIVKIRLEVVRSF